MPTLVHCLLFPSLFQAATPEHGIVTATLKVALSTLPAFSGATVVDSGHIQRCASCTKQFLVQTNQHQNHTPQTVI